MEKFNKYSLISKYYSLVFLANLMTLLLLTTNVRAQSAALSPDSENIEFNVIIQMSNYDYDVLVPKVTHNRLMTLKKVYLFQLVYITDGNPGFYMFLNDKWEKQNAISLLINIDNQLDGRTPRPKDLLRQNKETKPLLNYNGFISHLFEVLNLEKDNVAVTIE